MANRFKIEVFIDGKWQGDVIEEGDRQDLIRHYAAAERNVGGWHILNTNLFGFTARNDAGQTMRYFTSLVAR